MTRRLRFTALADRDLADLYRYGRTTFGVGPARDYVAKVNATIAHLRHNPMIGRSREDLASGLRSFVCARHTIYYRVIEDMLVVSRILHQARDVAAAPFPQA